MSVRSHTALAGAVVVLAFANLLNNRVATSAYVITSVVASAVLLALLRYAGVSWTDAGLGRATLRRGVRWGLVLAISVAVCYLVGALVPATRELFLDPRVEGARPDVIAYAVLVRVPLGTVLLEEVGFRGVLYGLVLRARGVVWATVVSSALFGLWHILPALRLVMVHPVVAPLAGAGSTTGIVLAVATATIAVSLAGVVMCELRRRSRSLLAAAGLHWTTNGLGYVTAYAVTQIG